MEHICAAIESSFPWLDRQEVELISRALPLRQDGTGAVAMREVAAALDRQGLPPTSSLLLNIVGRGSKGTAVQVARDIARERFDRSKVQVTNSTVESQMPLHESTVRSILQEFIAQLRPSASNAADSEIVQLVRALAGDVNWLKSTIDTERQLRRYQEVHGELGEPGPRAKANSHERRAIVSQLAMSLESDRFGSKHRDVDPADGAQE